MASTAGSKDKSEQETRRRPELLMSANQRWRPGAHPPPEEYCASDGSGAKQQRGDDLQSSRGPSRASTGGMPTMTAATPPSATKPIVPKLNRPAYPHCALSPRLMIAEIRHRLRIVSATDQLCARPTRTSSAKTESEQSGVSPVHFDPRVKRPVGLSMRTRMRMPKEIASL